MRLYGWRQGEGEGRKGEGEEGVEESHDVERNDRCRGILVLGGFDGLLDGPADFLILLTG